LGPLSITSVHGHKYFLTIVDDHSSFLWTILLKYKDKVSHHVQSFIKTVKTQFHITPKDVRSNNGPEFILTTFHVSLGIIHQKSFLKTPQKNGRVERRHQHILNVGRAILFQSKLPSSFWSYAILHVVFLINRITIPLLHHKSPFQILYDKLPNISSFKVFGFLCYVSSLQAHKTKLQTRARKKCFLGL